MSERKIKLLIELVFIFILPLVFIATTSEISISREFETINSENLPTLEIKSISFDNTLIKYYRSPQYFNYLNYNQCVHFNNSLYTQYFIYDNDFKFTLKDTIPTSSAYPNIRYTFINGHKYFIKVNVVGSVYTRIFYDQSYTIAKVLDQSTEDYFFNPTVLNGTSCVLYPYGGNAGDSFELNVIDLTQMFGIGYEPSTIEVLSSYIDLSLFQDYIVSELLTFESNNIISENYEINYTIWGKIKHLFIDYLDFNDNVLLDIIICYTVLWIAMFLIWHLFYRFIDFIVHLSDRKRC